MQPYMQKNHMDEDEVYLFLDRMKEGVLCTIGEDGYPYGIPMNYVRVGNKIYLHGNKIGDKVDNICRCNRVCFTVFDSDGFENCGDDACDTIVNYESVVARGTIRMIEDSSEKRELLGKLVASLTPVRMHDGINDKMISATGVFEITLDNVTGKFHRPMAGAKIFH